MVSNEVGPVSQLIRPLKRAAAGIGMAALLVAASAAPAAAQVYYPPAPYVGPDGAVKFDVKPKQALVYVDGFYAGIVDDFDGMFQRLYVEPGGHEITLYLDGYKTHSERAYLAPDHTFKIKFQMEKLAPGETSERPPTPIIPPRAEPPFGNGNGNGGGNGGRGSSGRRQQGPPNGQGRGPGPEPGVTEQSAPHLGRGTLELTLQPGDAEILIDGQSWPRTGADHVTIDLQDGHHNIQVRQPGYSGYLSDFEIHPGETTTLSVTLKALPPR
jgi:hypothetical protein